VSRSVGEELAADSPQVLDILCFVVWYRQLPGQDSNLDIESQNALAPERKSLPAKASGNNSGPLTAPLTCVAGDPDLARILDAWPDLPEHIKAAVLALVEAAGR